MDRIAGCRPITRLLAAVSLLTFAAPAAAQDGECETDADCEQGRVCEVVGATACPGSPPCEESPDGTIACPEPAPCESREFTRCVPGPCTDDTDCAEGERCVTETWTQCDAWATTDPACPPVADDDGQEPECELPDDEPIDLEEDCETVSNSTCQPRWQAPCEEASDCGPGFTCERSRICWCTMSAPSTPPGAGSAASTGDGSQEDAGNGETDNGDTDPAEADPPGIADDPNCGCEEADESYCRLIETPCEIDGDCDDGLTCQDWGVSGGCAPTPTATTRPPMQGSAGMPAPDSGDTMGDADRAGDDREDTTGTQDDPPSEVDPPAPGEPTDPTEPFVCEDTEPVVERRCMPPGYWGAPHGAPGSAGTDTSGGMTGEAAPDPTTDPGGPSAGNGSGGGAMTPGQAPPETPMPEPGNEDAEEAGTDDDNNAPTGHRRRHGHFRPWFWCSMTSPGTSHDSHLALLLGVPAWVLLRRRGLRRRAR